MTLIDLTIPIYWGRLMTCLKSDTRRQSCHVGLGKEYLLMIMLGVLIGPSLGEAQPRLKKINAAYVSTAGSFAVAWIGKEAKLFQKYGLDLELIKVPGSPRLVQAVLGGDLQFGHTGGISAVNAIAHGADLAILAQTSRGFSSHLMVKPSIDSLGGLRGKKIGVPQYGSTADLFLRQGLERWKLEPGRDVVIIQVGGMTEAFMALTAGALDGAVIPTELAFRARKAGFKDIFPFRNLDLKEMGASLIARRSYVKENDDTVRKFVMAFVEAIYLYKTEKDFSLKVLHKYTRNDDLEMLSVVRDEAIEVMDFLPLPREDDFAGSLRRIRKESGQGVGRVVRPDDVLEAKYIKDLEQSGFVRKIRQDYQGAETR